MDSQIHSTLISFLSSHPVIHAMAIIATAIVIPFMEEVRKMKDERKDKKRKL